jgi:hypothetical protein
MSFGRLLFAIAAIALLGLAGCKPKIGDPCRRAYDCSVRGERQCDVSNIPNDPDAKGECIIEGCASGSCPKEGICVKIYSTTFISLVCDPELEDLVDDESGELVSDCDPDEICLPEGLCADEISARTSCRFECKKDSDCRDNYHCVETGAHGIYLAPDEGETLAHDQGRLCVPRPPPD